MGDPSPYEIEYRNGNGRSSVGIQRSLLVCDRIERPQVESIGLFCFRVGYEIVRTQFGKRFHGEEIGIVDGTLGLGRSTRKSSDPATDLSEGVLFCFLLTESVEFPIVFSGRFLVVSEQDGTFVVDSALVSVGRGIPASLGRLSLGFDIVAKARRRGGIVDRILRIPIGHFYPDRRKKRTDPPQKTGWLPLQPGVIPRRGHKIERTFVAFPVIIPAFVRPEKTPDYRYTNEFLHRPR